MTLSRARQRREKGMRKRYKRPIMTKAFRKTLPIVVFLVLSLSLLSAAFADSDTLQPPTKDANILEEFPTTNFGDVITISAGSDLPAPNYERRSLVHISITSIPQGSTINSAELQLFMFSTPAVPAQIYVHQITSSWTETAVTWNNQPTTCTIIDSTVVGTTPDVWVSWDITDTVQNWLDGTPVCGVAENLGLAIIKAGFEMGFGSAFFRSREHSAESQRPKITVDYTPIPPETSYLVRLAGGITNKTSEVGEVNTVFNVQLENTGGTQFPIANVELLDDSSVLVIETNLGDVLVGETRNHAFTITHGLSEGSYSWQLLAYVNVSGSFIEYWNFTFYVGATGTLVMSFTADVIITPLTITKDETAIVSVSIRNIGTEISSFRASVSNPTMLISPNFRETTLQPGSGITLDFILYPLIEGRFTVGALVTPIQNGTAISNSKVFSFILTVIAENPSVTTYSADDIGVVDAIINGKIDSLGGFSSATVYFTFWESGLGVDSAYILPPNKQVVAFVSDYRVWVGDLTPGTSYTYELRMETGPASNPTTVYGGLISFTTTTEFGDPFIAIRNGLAQFLGIDSITMGILLSIGFILTFSAIFAVIVGGHTEGMAQAVLIASGMFGISSVFFAIGWLPTWILIFLGVIAAAIIIGLPTFQKDSE